MLRMCHDVRFVSFLRIDPRGRGRARHGDPDPGSCADDISVADMIAAPWQPPLVTQGASEHAQHLHAVGHCKEPRFANSPFGQPDELGSRRWQLDKCRSGRRQRNNSRRCAGRRRCWRRLDQSARRTRGRLESLQCFGRLLFYLAAPIGRLLQSSSSGGWSRLCPTDNPVYRDGNSVPLSNLRRSKRLLRR
jgi:hypothetical protein